MTTEYQSKTVPSEHRHRDLRPTGQRVLNRAGKETDEVECPHCHEAGPRSDMRRYRECKVAKMRFATESARLEKVPDTSGT